MSTFVTVKEKTLARCRKMGSTIATYQNKLNINKKLSEIDNS